MEKLVVLCGQFRTLEVQMTLLQSGHRTRQMVTLHGKQFSQEKGKQQVR